MREEDRSIASNCPFLQLVIASPSPSRRVLHSIYALKDDIPYEKGLIQTIKI